MRKNILYKIITGILLYFVLSTLFKLYNNTIISDSCLTDTFNSRFSDLTTLELNSTYDFDEIFDCQNWDEIFIIDAKYYSKGIGYLTSGVLIPDYDSNKYYEGAYLIYFLDNNLIVSKPNLLYDPNFIFSQNFEDGNHVRIERNSARFIYQKYEHSDYNFMTFKLKED